MATNARSGPTEEVSKVQNLIAGVQSQLTASSNFTVLGVSYLVSAITTKLQGYVTLEQSVQQTLSAYRAAVAARQAAAPDIQQFVSGLVVALKSQFGPGSPTLQAFGIAAPTARKQLTAEQKATAAALAKQTRAVRGPTGKNQRQKVTVQGSPGLVLVTPTGQQVPGVTAGPIAPAGGTPAAGK